MQFSYYFLFFFNKYKNILAPVTWLYECLKPALVVLSRLMVTMSKSQGQRNHKQWYKSRLLVCWLKSCLFLPLMCLSALTRSLCPFGPKLFASHLDYFNILFTDFSVSDLSTLIYPAWYFQTNFSKTHIYHVELYNLVVSSHLLTSLSVHALSVSLSLSSLYQPFS